MCTKTGHFLFTKGMQSYQSYRELWLGGSELQHALNYYFHHKNALRCFWTVSSYFDGFLGKNSLHKISSFKSITRLNTTLHEQICWFVYNFIISFWSCNTGKEIRKYKIWKHKQVPVGFTLLKLRQQIWSLSSLLHNYISD